MVSAKLYVCLINSVQGQKVFFSNHPTSQLPWFFYRSHHKIIIQRIILGLCICVVSIIKRATYMDFKATLQTSFRLLTSITHAMFVITTFS